MLLLELVLELNFFENFAVNFLKSSLLSYYIYLSYFSNTQPRRDLVKIINLSHPSFHTYFLSTYFSFINPKPHPPFLFLLFIFLLFLFP